MIKFIVQGVPKNPQTIENNLLLEIQWPSTYLLLEFQWPSTYLQVKSAKY